MHTLLLEHYVRSSAAGLATTVRAWIGNRIIDDGPSVEILVKPSIPPLLYNDRNLPDNY